MRAWVYWCAKMPGTPPRPYECAGTRTEAREEAERSTGQKWRTLRRKGWRLVKVKLVETQEDVYP